MIAEGFLVLPFSRRKRRHTGHHTAVPQVTAAPPGTRERRACPARRVVGRGIPPAGSRPGAGSDGKAQDLQEQGIDPYPVGREPSHTVAGAPAATDGTDVTVSGRVLRTRDYGGVTFATLRDWSGDVQLLLEKSAPGRPVPDFACVDLGDPRRGDRTHG